MMTAEQTQYKVRLTFRYPAWDEREGLLYYVTAKSKREAIKLARRMADNGGHLCAIPCTDYSFKTEL